MKISLRHFLCLLFFIAILLVVLLNKSFFIENLIVPLTRLLWLLVRLFEVFDQEVVWTILVFVVIIVGLLLIPVRQEDNFQSEFRNSHNNKDRITFWEELFAAAEKNAENKLSLQKNLYKLNHAIDELIHESEEKEISLPIFPTSGWHFILDKAKKLFAGKHPKGEKFQGSEFESNINRILNAMESKMEIQNDRSSSNPKIR